MSNKAKAPNGYNSKSVQDLSKESQQLLFELGQMKYNEDFSKRKQQEIQAKLATLEEQLAYAQLNAKTAEQAESEPTEETTTQPEPGNSSTEPTSAS